MVKTHISKASVAQRAGCEVRARLSEAHYPFNHATHLSLDAFPPAPTALEEATPSCSLDLEM